MDLYHDMAKIFGHELRAFGMPPNNSETDEQVIRRFLNVLLKLIPTHPRTIRKSDAMGSVVLPADLAATLHWIEGLIESGGNLNPMLSKGIFKPDAPDFLLFDWAMHHLHLSDKKKKPTDYFMKRSPKLLFAVITDAVVYMVDVRDHNENNLFSKKELLEVIARHWPELLEPYKLRGILGLGRETNADDLKKLREAGINVLQDVVGGFYGSMGGGITTAKTSLRVTLEHDRLARRFWQIEKDIPQSDKEIRQMMLNEGLTPPAVVNFSLLGLDEAGCVLKETGTGFLLQYKFEGR